MKNDKWIELSSGVAWSIVFSLIALAISIIALANGSPRKLEIDYLGIIVGILALLITFLVGWQIWQTMATKDEIKEMRERNDGFEIRFNRLERRAEEAVSLLDAESRLRIAGDQSTPLPARYRIYMESILSFIRANLRVYNNSFEQAILNLSGLLPAIRADQTSHQMFLNDESIYDETYRQIMRAITEEIFNFNELQTRLIMIHDERIRLMDELRQESTNLNNTQPT